MFVLILLLLVLSASHPANAKELTCTVPVARQIVDAIQNQQFNHADNLIKSSPADPLKPYLSDFYASILAMARANYVGTKQREKYDQQAIEYLNKTLSVIKQDITNKHADSEQSALYQGMSEAFLARIYLENKQYRKAYKLGRRGRDRLRKLIKTSPHLYDAYLVLGLYEYYTGSVPFGLKWLVYLFDLSGDRERGLEYLATSFQSAPLAAPEAGRVFIEELSLSLDERCQYLPVYQHMQKNYPQNRGFNLKLQRDYRQCGYTNKALQLNTSLEFELRKGSRMQQNNQLERLLELRDLGDLAAIEAMRINYEDKQRWKEIYKQAKQVKFKLGSQTEMNDRQKNTIERTAEIDMHRHCN